MGLTRDAVFFDAFSNHASKSVAASRLLSQMLKNLGESKDFAHKITVLEDEGDKITHACVAALHQTWITPLDREEIHALVTRLDDVLDSIEAASERVVIFEITEATEECHELCTALEKSCEAMQSAVDSLRDLKAPKKILDLCIEINRRENEADVLYRKGLARLYNGSSDPLMVMKWRDIYDYLEIATDRCEDVANIIEGVVLEHA
jgi:predicted phosphate transport protein (TIGR00153 family)